MTKKAALQMPKESRCLSMSYRRRSGALRNSLRKSTKACVANVRELRAISHSDRKSDTVDAEKIARYARLDPKILRPISHRTVAQQEALTLIRARNLIVRPRTAAVNSVRGLAKPCGYRLPTSSTLCFAKRCMAQRARMNGAPGWSSTGLSVTIFHDRRAV